MVPFKIVWGRGTIDNARRSEASVQQNNPEESG